jgi:hypothetical protein
LVLLDFKAKVLPVQLVLLVQLANKEIPEAQQVLLVLLAQPVLQAKAAAMLTAQAASMLIMQW